MLSPLESQQAHLEITSCLKQWFLCSPGLIPTWITLFYLLKISLPRFPGYGMNPSCSAVLQCSPFNFIPPTCKLIFRSSVPLFINQAGFPAIISKDLNVRAVSMCTALECSTFSWFFICITQQVVIPPYSFYQ